MQRSCILSLVTLSLLSPLVHAGVVMDMVSRDSSGLETDRSKFYSQSKMVRMDQGEDGDVENSMIFLGDHFVYLNHRDKSYIVMDEEMLEQVSTKIDDAMKEMEAQLANMPPEQRAMVEQMMKGRMQGVMGQQREKAPEPRVESMGTSKWQSYKCKQYAIFEGPEKTQEVCAAKLDEVDGADEVMEAFVGMAAYIEKMTESLPMMENDGLNPGELMKQIDGFPVHTVDYVNGKAEREMSLDSVVEEDLDPNLFVVPKDYRREDPMRR